MLHSLIEVPWPRADCSSIAYPFAQGVSLALSLHAPNQALRASIVPSARAYPLDRLMAAITQYQADSKQRVFMEYVMLSGVNDGATLAPRRIGGTVQLVWVVAAHQPAACARHC